jgi:hypothetical protein
VREEPALRALERPRLEAHGAHAPDLLGPHEAARLERRHVLADRGERDVVGRGELAHRARPRAQLLDQRTPRRVREREEDAVERRVRRMLKHGLQYLGGRDDSQVYASPSRARRERGVDGGLVVDDLLHDEEQRERERRDRAERDVERERAWIEGHRCAAELEGAELEEHGDAERDADRDRVEHELGGDEQPHHAARAGDRDLRRLVRASRLEERDLRGERVRRALVDPRKDEEQRPEEREEPGAQARTDHRAVRGHAPHERVAHRDRPPAHRFVREHHDREVREQRDEREVADLERERRLGQEPEQDVTGEAEEERDGRAARAHAREHVCRAAREASGRERTSQRRRKDLLAAGVTDVEARHEARGEATTARARDARHGRTIARRGDDAPDSPRHGATGVTLSRV